MELAIINRLIRKINKTKENINYLYAFYFATFFSLFYNPLDNNKLSVIKFKRKIGLGIIKNVDISSLIRNFYVYIFLYFILFYFVIILINIIKSRKNDELSKKTFRFLDNLVILGVVNIVVKSMNYFSSNNVNRYFNYSSYFFTLIIILGIIYIVLDLNLKVSPEKYLKLVIINLIIGLIFSFLFFDKNFGKILILSQIIFQIITIVILKSNITNSRNISKIKINEIFMYFCILPIMTSVFIEMINILNQYKIFIKNPRKMYMLFIILSFIFWVLIIKNINYKKYKKICYPLLIIGISGMSVQLFLQEIYNPDIFEGANSGILISEFFSRGSIPIVEHYGGHMMSDVWEGLVYGILNNDKFGAIVSPYSVFFICISALLFYMVLKEFLNKEIATIIVLFFPIYTFWNYFSIGILVYFSMKFYIKKMTYKRAFVLWGSVIWCMLYRLDLGYSFMMAALCTIVMYIIKFKKINILKQVFISLVGSLMFCLMLWFIICIFKNINPLYRLKEFILISLSNQNWAYGTIGNEDTSVFFWSYMFIPFIMLSCMVYLILHFNILKYENRKIWILLLILGFSYFFNFSRGLVRHSLAENKTKLIIWSAYVFLAMFFSYIIKKKIYFLPIYMFLLVLNTLFFTPLSFNENSILENLNLKIEQIKSDWNNKKYDNKTYWEKIANERKVINRVELDEHLKATVLKYKQIIDVLLKKKETFVDFINKTLLYSVLNKKNPVYISQSPLQLSGEFSQEQFIKQIKGIPIVFMPIDDNRSSATLDGFSNLYRYYKVSEYIYQNYVPLIKYGNEFSVWCLKEKYNELKSKIQKNKDLEIEYKNTLLNSGIIKHNVEILKTNNGNIRILSTGIDPIVDNISNFINLKKYVGREIKIEINYKSNLEGEMQLYYTTEKNEEYSENKVRTSGIKKFGEAEFIIPVTDYTKFRLDIPEKSDVEITSIKIETPIENIDYGYDDLLSKQFNYLSFIHNYDLEYLPYIWANYDTKKAINNRVLSRLISVPNNRFLINPLENNYKIKGNYLLVTGNFKNEEKVTIKLGNLKDNIFSEKYKYNFIAKEGTQNYLLRVSTDYYWYTNEINSVEVVSENGIKNVSMKILEGD